MSKVTNNGWNKNTHTHTNQTVDKGNTELNVILLHLAQSEMFAGEFPHIEAYWAEEVRVIWVLREDVAEHLGPNKQHAILTVKNEMKANKIMVKSENTAKQTMAK